jgi:hypothetical protein
MKNIYIFLVFSLLSCNSISDRSTSTNIVYPEYWKFIPNNSEMIAQPDYKAFDDSIMVAMKNLGEDEHFVNELNNYFNLIELFDSSFQTRNELIFTSKKQGFIKDKAVKISMLNGYKKNSLVNIVALNKEYLEINNIIDKIMKATGKKAFRGVIITKIEISIITKNLFRSHEAKRVIYLEFFGQIELLLEVQEL